MKHKTKNLSLIIGLVIGLFMLSGCADSLTNAEQSLNPTDTKETYIPAGTYKTIDKVINSSVTISATVDNPLNNNNSASSFMVSKTKFDVDTIKSSLWTNYELISENTFPDVYTCQTKDGNYLTVANRGSISMVSQRYLNKIQPFVYINEGSLYNGDCYISDEDLPFMTQNQARDKAMSLLEKIGASNMEVESIYVLKNDTLKEQYDLMSQEGDIFSIDKKTGEKIYEKKRFTEEDDCYLIKLREVVNGISLLSNNHGNPDDDSYVAGSSGQIIISNSGIENLDICGHYSVTNEEDIQPIINVDSAVKTIETKYSQVLLDHPISIEKISLESVPTIDDKEKDIYRLVPSWIFYSFKEVSEMGNSEKSKIPFITIVNALNSQEML